MSDTGTPDGASTPVLTTRLARRPGPADPVKTLMHSHRELCEHAVDPLEIAAGLEAHGVTDRAAARFRHRDVFSLAEELYARVPRSADGGRDTAEATTPHPARSTDPRAGWALRTLLPGAVCATAVVALRYADGADSAAGGLRPATGLVGGVALAVALTVALRRGPLRVEGHTAGVSRLWVCWLLAYVLYGDVLTHATAGDGPHGTDPLAHAAAPLVALAFAVAPAAWCAHLLAVQARRRLAHSRSLAEFASRTRPVLLGLLALYAVALAVLAVLAELVLGGDRGAGTGHPVTTVALGCLLLLARLLTVHGFPGAAATGLATACAVEAAALLLTTAGRVPGFASVSAPVRALVEAWGAGAVPALACGAAALGLLIHATVALSRASAHT
ncbi:hypothetical protein GCM10011583_69140 [Streptomyces camponoticapitis]|uniref:Integral membrane protein n=1 Tax=Streptomyces camponoticapitis TaxID=1616125 RepID=A0ABQ2EUN4_9ACTN|nr:hypothetical protein [Streptomyces camponoticapitis]GGK27267.1 hypothetical protein GCM10011583_69140 [Streptomyces camponoticapitis]